MMDKQKKIYYENVIPTISSKSIDIQFKDSNDILIEEKKKKK